MASNILCVLAYLCVLTSYVEAETSTVAVVDTPDTPMDTTMTSTSDSMTSTTSSTTMSPTTQAHSDHVTCYSCKFLSNLSNCRFAKHCPAGSSCLTGQLTSGLYYLDCVPSPACAVLPAQLQSAGKVTYLNQQFKRFECCSSLKCNKNAALFVG
ncbi:uncharacterized protein LOC134704971 [Mytilus trossulus]|uniref:uncharacterized protein LOC134704971 n=1 Tax=Mytilus trossulus TaxID=6551 RepID=UPI0030076BF7